MPLNGDSSVAFRAVAVLSDATSLPRAGTCVCCEVRAQLPQEPPIGRPGTSSGWVDQGCGRSFRGCFTSLLFGAEESVTRVHRNWLFPSSLLLSGCPHPPGN